MPEREPEAAAPDIARRQDLIQELLGTVPADPRRTSGEFFATWFVHRRGSSAWFWAAFWASRLVESRLYGIAPQDPLTLAAAIGLLLFVALSAAYLPAKRVSKMDPMAALCQE